MDLPKVLVKLLDTLLTDHMLTSWNIMEEQNSNVVVKLRFFSGHIGQHKGAAEQHRPQSYGRKSPAQIRRDHARFSAYTQQKTQSISTGEGVTQALVETTGVVTRSMTANKIKEYLDIEQARCTSHCESPSNIDGYNVDVSDISDTSTVLSQPELLIPLSHEVLPFIPHTDSQICDMALDKTVQRESFVPPLDLCEFSDQISSDFIISGDVFIPEIVSSETEDSLSDLDVEQSPTAGNIDLNNPDHIQQSINVVRDAIRETIFTW